MNDCDHGLWLRQKSMSQTTLADSLTYEKLLEQVGKQKLITDSEMLHIKLIVNAKLLYSINQMNEKLKNQKKSAQIFDDEDDNWLSYDLQKHLCCERYFETGTTKCSIFQIYISQILKIVDDFACLTPVDLIKNNMQKSKELVENFEVMRELVQQSYDEDPLLKDGDDE